ncbi:TBC1 domain family member 13-like [Clytia hemisphaerica]
MAVYKQRLDQFEECLKQSKIDLKQFQTLCFAGIPDKPSLRSLAWKILLYYLPRNHDDWDDVLRKQRAIYKNYVEEIVAHPADCKEAKEHVDHPLNMNPDSQWITYFKDNEVLLQIDRDVRRLCPDISFFQHPTKYPIQTIIDVSSSYQTLTKRVETCVLDNSVIGTSKGGLSNITIKKYSNEEYVVLPQGQEAHWQVVERILFIYAKLNPGISYVQGMNEIIGPIYYTFASDADEKWKAHAEADAFFCFTAIMAEIRDNFIKTLDDSELGIGQDMNKLYCLLQVKDEEVYDDLSKKGMKPQFFAFRWITLLLSQEFYLPDVIRLWDSLFADQKRFDFLLYVCLAMLVLIRDQILEGDFAKTMKIIQNFPHDQYDMATIIRKAVELNSPTALGVPVEKPPAPASGSVTGKSISARGFSLKQRLVNFARNDNSSNSS